jgi:hypothetical protein
MRIKAGSTNVSVYYYIVQDASATSPGEPVTGLLFSDIETGGSASYARQGAARVDLTLITLASASATHADGGFILVDDTNMPGLYRCDYPDAAFVTGVSQTFLQIVVASANNAVAAPILIDIDDNVDQTVDNNVLAAGSTGFAAIDTVVDAILVDTGTTIPGLIGTPAADISADIAAVKVDTAATLVDTAQIGVAGAGLTDLGGMSTTMKGQVNTEADTALTDYDGPTNTEMIARTLVAAAYFDPAADAVANVTLCATTTTNTDMVGTDNALLASAAPTNFGDLSISVTTGLVDITQTAADKIWGTTARILTASTNFNDLSAASVNAEMLDVLVTDTHAEVTIPAATASIKDMIHYTFSRVRNKTTQTATTLTLRNDADSGDLGSATVSDDGTTFTKGEES